MEKLVIPDKTFKLYKDGQRTFVHILRDEENANLKERLKFGESVLLVNKDTDEQMEEIFWFVLDFKNNDRFLIIVFQNRVKSSMFYARKRHALILSRSERFSRTISTEFLPNYQQHSFNMLSARSALLFIDGDHPTSPGSILSFKGKNEKWLDHLVVLDVLRLKTKDDQILECYSLFPMDDFQF